MDGKTEREVNPSEAIEKYKKAIEKYKPIQPYEVSNSLTEGNEYFLRMDWELRERGLEGDVLWRFSGYVEEGRHEGGQEKPADVSCDLIIKREAGGLVLYLAVAKPKETEGGDLPLIGGFTIEVWNMAVNKLAPLLGIEKAYLSCVNHSPAINWAKDHFSFEEIPSIDRKRVVLAREIRS